MRGTLDRGLFDRVFDACVIGAGPAGLTLARAIAAAGLEVALMSGWARGTAEAQDAYAGENGPESAKRLAHGKIDLDPYRLPSAARREAARSFWAVCRAVSTYTRVAIKADDVPRRESRMHSQPKLM